MLRIRLSRVGKKKQPSYRIVVADSRAPREGAFLKIIGHYNPLTDPATVVVKEEEAIYWLGQGARPSDTAAKLLTRTGVMEKAGRPPARYKGKEMPRAPQQKKAGARAPQASAAEATAEAAESEPASSAAVEPAEEEATAAAGESPAETEPEATE